jgi:hypothetical protein
MAADATRSLAGGAVVETRLCARILGLKLLVVDGVVTLWPARAVPAAPAARSVGPDGVRWRDVEPEVGSSPGGRLGATAARLQLTAARLQQLSDDRRRA